jgi:hypothetical protein
MPTSTSAQECLVDLDALLSATRKAHHFKLDGLLAAKTFT